jgi:hypothetical protein
MGFMWGEGAKGLWIGALLGALVGLGAGMWLFEHPLLFQGETILLGAILCGLAGFLFGGRFFEWLAECWHWFVG